MSPPAPHKDTAAIRQSLVVFAKNKARLSAFYRETLGLTLVEEESSHDLLQGPGIEIVIHGIPRQYAMAC